ncbi:P-loop NTPase family protein [Maribacter antarcticus]|uniref:hypothetical protein n=1 Tax=Maribacter antarcticus TaxID=505250 RepID=UPI000479618B|nr:hypothetical protein [Maribacter antarcticus]
MKKKTDFKHLDVDDYYWKKTEPPFQEKLSLKKRNDNLKVDLLVSEDYLETIGHNSRFNSAALRATELRGRNEKINLHTINQN